MVIVEYLFIVKKANSFCKTTKAFIQLLNVDEHIHATTKKIKFEDDFECDVNIQVGEQESPKQRHFQIRFTLRETATEANLDVFAKMLRTFRNACQKLDGELHTQWDDISQFYSELCYKTIHRVENLMRKLITNFMLINVGSDWVKKATPKAVQNSIETSKRGKQAVNVLHSVDFIDLSKHMLHAYPSKPLDEMSVEIAKLTPENGEKLEQFKIDFIPRSNWTRYFSEIVDCDEEYLKKRWERLYDLRCMIAHNSIIAKKHYEEISKLSNELEDKLVKAIEKVNEVEVPEDAVEHIISDVKAPRVKRHQRPSEVFEAYLEEAALRERAEEAAYEAHLEAQAENADYEAHLRERAEEAAYEAHLEAQAENADYEAHLRERADEAAYEAHLEAQAEKADYEAHLRELADEANVDV